MVVDLHIDGGQGTVGDGAADGTSKGKSGVESQAGELLRSGGGGVDLSGRHYCGRFRKAK